MSDRGLPSADASPACPFVAFDDDRDGRADRPDHRHRCFAEPEPAPRALAHQEAYCLSSAFPVCPTFQAWARREAAHARPEAARPDAAAATPDPERASSGPTRAEEWSDAPRPPEVPIESTPRRNPPRDWAAPPPWAAGMSGAAGAGTGRAGAPDDALPLEPPSFTRPTRAEGQGLAGSAADRLAGGEPVTDPRPRGDVPSIAPDPDLAGLVGGSAAAAGGMDAPAAAPPTRAPSPPPTRAGRRPTVSSTRRSGPDRNQARLPQHEHVQRHDGPAWEEARRYEAYPTIKARPALPSIGGLPRGVLLAGALGIAAVGLFFLPALLGFGGDEDGASPSPSASQVVASASPAEPTATPAPTPQTYTIQAGDTLSKIAREFGLTVDQLLEANTETITDPDRISVGDVIIIPTPPPDEVSGGGASATPEP